MPPYAVQGFVLPDPIWPFMLYCIIMPHDQLKEFMLHSLGGRILIFDLFGRLMLGRSQTMHEAGLSPGAEIRKSYPEAWLLFQEVMKTGHAVHGFELHGEQRVLRIDVFPMVAPDQPKGVLALLHNPGDRTWRSDANPLMQDSSAILDASEDGIWICDHEAKVVQINKAAERLNQVSNAEVAGRSMHDLVAEGMFDYSITLEVLETGGPVTRLQNTRSGRRLLSTGNPVYGQEGQIALVVTSDRDVTELGKVRQQILRRTDASRRYQDELLDRRLEDLAQQDIISRSPVMEKVIETAIRVAKVSSSVMITGPSGSGKEMIADLIHRSSKRAKGPLVKVNCGAVPENLFESELFGYEPGAFTGADRRGKPGLVEAADQGTLFLDEVGEMPLDMQVKLLRFLDNGLVNRVGATKGRRVDVRVIAATNRDLEQMLKAGQFRQDLYYRLKVVPIRIPPLKERPQDIPALADHFLARFQKETGGSIRLAPQTMDLFMAYDFPGNVRELANLCERLAVMSTGDAITPADLPANIRKGAHASAAVQEAYKPHSLASSCPVPAGGSLKERVEAFERALLQETLSRFSTQQAAARQLGVDQSTIARKMKKHGLG
jgi:PAS domain S-box-containing protein